jgi:hypothetical protein
MTFRNLQEAASSLRELARLQLLKEGGLEPLLRHAKSWGKPWENHGKTMGKAGENHGILMT